MTRESTGAVPTDGQYMNDLKILLGKYGLKTMKMSTVCHWMKSLGFKHEVRRKGYYVDGHEKPSTIEYHKHFVSWYLTYECRAHHLIQIDAKESSILKNKGLVPKDSGYRYKTKNGEEMVEYHVESCKEFQERMNEETKFGGRLSVRMKKRGETIDNIGAQ
jgi:hypothetical protein